MKTDTSAFLAKPCTAFCGFEQVAAGALVDVALAVKAFEAQPAVLPLLVFDDASGEVVDLDLLGSTAEIVARLAERARQQVTAARAARKSSACSPAQKPGRPRLGVVAREVTLLPRHWEWLAMQTGGASAALRRLVEEARLSDQGKTSQRQAQEAAYRFLSAVAGNLSGFEETTRALFASDWNQFAARTASWPDGIRAYAERLACRRGESA
ncbi:DUF2239 family protein [Telmatobacter bradus]|uniref:DUF2239 family protein n=1 Tax=Telmatobacter bradus TaxID=474953 RepID=UPI003B42F708